MTYAKTKEYSNSKLALLREALSGVAPQGCIVVTCGSFARKEASTDSDIDFFFITNEESIERPSSGWTSNVESKISGIVKIEPSSNGAFARCENRDEMLCNIGGESDTNAKITRRILFLLEGEWLVDEAGAKHVRRCILERYIGETVADHHLALFLLNDIIRYWRTIAVDYEFKTGEGVNPKPWGIRNIKLVFSRKLLYASGLFSVALTVNKTREKKIEMLEQLFDLPVIERMTEICGESNMRAVLNTYDKFLDKLADTDIRNRLKSLKRNERDDKVFRELKNDGHCFARELLKLFEDTFDTTHPIRRAVLF
jgi:hypothetical protein